MQIAHMIRNLQIIRNCRDHKTPTLIVNPEVLTNDFETLADNIGKSQMGLAIPLERISKYYKLPISDCTVTNNQLYVNIRIPITNQKTTWELYELLTTPFAWKNETRVVMHDQ